MEARRPDILERVVLMTHGAQSERAQRLLVWTSIKQIEKPFDLEQLSALLTRRPGVAH